MGRTKIEYVVNNRVSFSTKKGILGPGKDISKSDFINPERFDKFLSEGKIILKEDYEKM